MIPDGTGASIQQKGAYAFNYAADAVSEHPWLATATAVIVILGTAGLIRCCLISGAPGSEQIIVEERG